MEEIVTKKQKIMISIIAIFLVLITLLGITYAYFLTRVRGNTNENSVILSTANLLLEYDDGNEILESDGVIIPGTTIESKTFSVENKGTETISNYGIFLENVINNFERTQDVLLTITCKVYDTVNKVYLETTCNGLTDSTYPTINGLLITNSIDINRRHDYTLKVNYKNEVEIDQSNDMDKTIKGKIQIYDLNDIVNISGTVANAQDGDYIVLGDNSQISQIKNGTYKLVGIAPETYTIYVKNDTKNANGEVVTTIKGSKTIQVELGEEEKLENDILYVTSSSQNITLNITSINTELTIEKVN